MSPRLSQAPALTAPHGLAIHAMSAGLLERVQAFEAALREYPQAEIGTQHLFHAGLYARTICLPAGHELAGALIQIPTVLIVSGRAQMVTEDGIIEIDGYQVIPAAANRRQAMHAVTDTHMTAIFATQSTTVAEAEAEATPEAARLIRSPSDLFTGESLCHLPPP